MALASSIDNSNMMTSVAGAVVEIAMKDRWTSCAALAATIELALPALAHLYQIANTCNGLTFACGT